jgi:tripartite-type tricarboxylate transporter receptor subunit TctC
VTFGSPGIGTSQHLAGEMLKVAAGLDMTHVPYRGGPAAYPDLISGRIDLLVDVVVTAAPQVREGRAKAIAVTTAERVPLVRDVPTVAETIPGFTAVSWLGFVAPAGVPAGLLDRLATAVRDAIRTPYTWSKIAESGAIPVGSTAAEFDAFMRAEHARWLPAVRASGASLD